MTQHDMDRSTHPLRDRLASLPVRPRPAPSPAGEVDPVEVERGRIRNKAAGIEAVAVTAQRGVEQMGLVRSVKTLRIINQTEGFDCMGCAWPDPSPKERSFAEFCENGAKAVAEEATLRRVGRDFFAAHDVDELVGWSDFMLGQQGRLTEPMVLRAGSTHYEPISWADAFALVADRLNGLASPDEAVFYTSGRASNEAAFVYQLFVRAFGTNNLPDCSNMCHESTSVALAETIGIGKGSVSLEDIHDAELIVIAGQNPGTNHPRMLSALEKAKKKGARIVAVNPLPETGLRGFDNPQTVKGLTGVGTELADEFMPIRLGGDLALFQALGALLVAADDAGRDAIDHEFVQRHTEGYEQWAQSMRELDWDLVDRATSLDRAQIERVAEMFISSRRTVVCWAMGVTQHRHAVATIKEITNVCLVQGNIGKPGAGLCPVRGHSNVQGDRTMGIWEKLPPHFGDALEREFGITAPTERGHDVVNSIRALCDGEVKVAVSLGGNLAAAAPDTAVTFAAMRNAKLNVHIATKLNRSHVVVGEEALILPTLGRTERDVQAGGPQGVTVEDSMSSVHLSHGRLDPASAQLRSEVSIICGIADATLKGRGGAEGDIDWTAMAGDYGVIRGHISRVVPGCEAYDEKVHRPGGFVLPHPPRDSRTFETPSGKAVFTTSPLEMVTAPEGHLVLQSLRSHDQFNTTIYGHDDRYRGLSGGRDVVMVHPDDLAAQGFADGDLVDVVAPWSDGSVRVVHGFRAVSYPTTRGCVAAYYPETNPLVALDSTAEGSNCPVSKAVVVKLVPAGQGPRHSAIEGLDAGEDDWKRSEVKPHHLS
ncbi:molybdopterin-dependent oxidoreductase alpha subunit [Terracoccus luteus]|uniref:Molybdopterin-dependent oxidoreductase alpha subunit n=1 Tax=Terracoccus luteus TaxID=53356 RepID=A0A495Y368_9MICO|nr:FdhF/YdeP family oxidoreductase [Terracoccus luteus]RKT78618.1 molybdopterin-dependent oxidoreductase alpha subunit [Terracoccus luteus]